MHSQKAKHLIDDVVQKADEAITKTYAILTTSDYMLFNENGNRSKYERPYFERRNDCSYVSVAYWLTEDEKYVKLLIDLIFMICDEFTWCLPAHTHLEKNPSVEWMITHIDLFQ